MGHMNHNELWQLEQALIEVDIYQMFTRQIKTAKYKEKNTSTKLQKRQQFLEWLANNMVVEENQDRAKIIWAIKDSESKNKMYRMFMQYLKPKDKTRLIQANVP